MSDDKAVTYNITTGHLPDLVEERIAEVGGAITVQDEGVALTTTASILNFVGTGVAATGTGATKTITVSAGSAITVQDEGVDLTTAATTLNFTGTGVTASGTGGTKTINVSSGSAITVQDEGTPLSTAATTLNFVGSAVTATGSGATKTITVSAQTAGENVNRVAASGASQTIPAPQTSTVSKITLSADCTLALSTWTDDGDDYSILVDLFQPDSGGVYDYDVDWVGTIHWLDGGTRPVLATGQGARTRIALDSDDGGATWTGSSSVPNPGNQVAQLTIDGTGHVATPVADGDIFDLLLTQNVTMDYPTGSIPNGKTLTYRITQDGTGNWTVAWVTGFHPAPSFPITPVSASPNSRSIYSFMNDAGSGKLDHLGNIPGF